MTKTSRTRYVYQQKEDVIDKMYVWMIDFHVFLEQLTLQYWSAAAMPILKFQVQKFVHKTIPTKQIVIRRTMMVRGYRCSTLIHIS